MIETLLFSIILLYHIVILYRSLPELDGNPLRRVNMCLILFCSVMEGDMYRIAGIEFDHVVQILRSSAATRSSWLRLELQILVR